MSSYEFRMWGIRKRDRQKPYQVRWLVAGHSHAETFVTRALAESFRAELMAAARSGEAFDEEHRHPAPGADPRASGLVARPRQQRREVGDERRVRGRRTHHGQVGRHLRIALDELVALRPAEPARLHQLLEPCPLVRVREHVGVEVHADSLEKPWPPLPSSRR